MFKVEWWCDNDFVETEFDDLVFPTKELAEISAEKHFADVELRCIGKDTKELTFEISEVR